MRWYAAISLLTDVRIRFLLGFVLVAIIVAVVLIILEMNVREKAKREREKLILKPADRIKIFIESDKSLMEKLAFLDVMAKEYFTAMYKFSSTISYSKLVSELERANHKTEVEFCKRMFYIFYSKEGATEQGILELARLLEALENNRTAEELRVDNKLKAAKREVKEENKLKIEGVVANSREVNGGDFSSDKKDLIPKIDYVNMTDLKKKENSQNKSSFGSWFSRARIENKDSKISRGKEDEVRRKLQEQFRIVNDANRASGSRDLIKISKGDTFEAIKKKLEKEKQSLSVFNTKSKKEEGEMARQKRRQEKEARKLERVRIKEAKKREQELRRLEKNKGISALPNINLENVPVPDKTHFNIESKMNNKSMIKKEMEIMKKSDSLKPNSERISALSEEENRKIDEEDARARARETSEREKKMRQIEREEIKRRKKEKKKFKKFGITYSDYPHHKESSGNGLASRIISSQKSKLEAEYY